MGKKKPTRKSLRERKRRTREHIIADLSVHHVEGFVLQNGFTAERVTFDYGYDLSVTTFDDDGFAESGEIKLQLKATDNIHRLYRSSLDGFSYSVRRADYLRWMEEVFPVFLILYDASGHRAYWQYVQRFFHEQPPSVTSTQTVTLRIPKKNRLRKGTIEKMRQWKQEIIDEAKGKRHG